jgi:DNA-binding IclR family transcriptional regulator
MVKSLDRALNILEYLSKRRSAGVTEIAEEFNVDKSSVFRILKTFEKHGLVAKNESNFKYYIGAGVLQLSYKTQLRQKIVKIAHPSLVDLSNLLNTTARLCMVEGKRVYVIDQAIPTQGKNAKDTDIPGSNKPLYCSSIGKVILAYLPEESLSVLLGKMELIRYTENTITDPSELKKALKKIKQLGYALNVAEYSDRTYCIAVPVFNVEDDQLRYCVGITGWTDFRKDNEKLEWIIAYMKEISEHISRDYVKMAREHKDLPFSIF